MFLDAPPRTLLLVLLIPLLTACGGANGATTPKSAVGKPALTAPRMPVRTPVRPPVHRQPPAARVLALPGLEGVIGATSAELIRQFGTARLDVWEGDARKLQFSGVPCVLDIYLYPTAKDREPQATYLDARRSDGRDVDRVACVAALRQK